MCKMLQSWFKQALKYSRESGRKSRRETPQPPFRHPYGCTFGGLFYGKNPLASGRKLLDFAPAEPICRDREPPGPPWIGWPRIGGFHHSLWRQRKRSGNWLREKPRGFSGRGV